jgi:hypothetical protein
MYAALSVEALRCAARAWPIAPFAVVYWVIWMVAAILSAPLGWGAGLVLGLVSAALVSSYLYLIEQAVSRSRIGWSDLGKSFGAYFWDAVSVMFALWIISIASGIVVRSFGSQGPFIAAVIGLLIAVFFNAAPELLYQGHVRSFHLLMESASFIQRNWLEWFIPNTVFALLLLAPSPAFRSMDPREIVYLAASLFTLEGLPVLATAMFQSARSLALGLAALAVAHYAMIYRGLLFKELRYGSRRMREFRARMG